MIGVSCSSIVQLVQERFAHGAGPRARSDASFPPAETEHKFNDYTISEHYCFCLVYARILLGQDRPDGDGRVSMFCLVER